MFRLCMTIVFAASFTLGKVAEAQGPDWDGSFLFITSVIFALGFRVAIRVQSGAWVTDNEWLYFPLYLLFLVGLWLWVRAWDAAFVVVGGFALYLWIDYLRGQLTVRDRDT
jgi:hypothetical protein